MVDLIIFIDRTLFALKHKSMLFEHGCLIIKTNSGNRIIFVDDDVATFERVEKKRKPSVGFQSGIICNNYQIKLEGCIDCENTNELNKNCRKFEGGIERAYRESEELYNGNLPEKVLLIQHSSTNNDTKEKQVDLVKDIVSTVANNSVSTVANNSVQINIFVEVLNFYKKDDSDQVWQDFKFLVELAEDSEKDETKFAKDADEFFHKYVAQDKFKLLEKLAAKIFLISCTTKGALDLPAKVMKQIDKEINQDVKLLQLSEGYDGFQSFIELEEVQDLVKSFNAMKTQ